MLPASTSCASRARTCTSSCDAFFTEARSNNRRASVDCRVTEDGTVRPITIEVIPVVDPETKVRCFMVLFHEEKNVQAAQEASDAAIGPDAVRRRKTPGRRSSNASWS